MLFATFVIIAARLFNVIVIGAAIDFQQSMNAHMNSLRNNPLMSGAEYTAMNPRNRADIREHCDRMITRAALLAGATGLMFTVPLINALASRREWKLSAMVDLPITGALFGYGIYNYVTTRRTHEISDAAIDEVIEEYNAWKSAAQPGKAG